MIDKKKRQTLKGIAAVAGATAAASIPAFAITSPVNDTALTGAAVKVRQVWPPVAVRTPVRVSSRRAANQEFEVVLTNKGQQPVTMTQITPSTQSVPQGNSIAHDVMNDGPIHLAAGESVGVPLQAQAVNGSARALDGTMRSSFSVTTDEDQFAAVSYVVVA